MLPRFVDLRREELDVAWTWTRDLGGELLVASGRDDAGAACDGAAALCRSRLVERIPVSGVHVLTGDDGWTMLVEGSGLEAAALRSHVPAVAGHYRLMMCRPSP